MPKGVPTTATCPVVEDGVVCGRHADAHGMCKKHWTRFMRHGDPTFRKLAWGDPETRFFQKVNKDGPTAKNNPELGPCWIWTAFRAKDGRGRFGDGDRTFLAHRWAYEHWVGPIPEGQQLDHFACDNGEGGCVNPGHVRPATSWENTLRSNAPAAWYKARDFCHWGHEFTPENTSIQTDGSRRCRACHNARRRRGDPRKKQSITHCIRGHEFTPENTVIRADGYRTCRQCARERPRKPPKRKPRQ